MADTTGARRNDGVVDNVHQGVFAGETRTITTPAIAGIGPNMPHPTAAGVTATGPFVDGKVPTKSNN